MSDEHKAALAEGRNQSRAVRLYLEALDASKPKRGRPRTAESIQKRVAAISHALPSASPVQKLELVQEKIDLKAELASLGTEVDLTDLEVAFVESASVYSYRKGISYTGWRTVGVPAAVLKRAGVSRSS